MQKAELIEMEIKNFILFVTHQNEQEAEAEAVVKGRRTTVYNMYECLKIFMNDVFED
jgi:hypothetical protein